jgi:sterol desaturase/sphingolipid hydroxylase (fatty acid hydroxylase superfamily)
MSQDLHSLLIQVSTVSIWLIGLVVVFVPLERWFSVHDQKLFRKDLATDLGYYYLNSVVPVALLGVPVGLLAWLIHGIVPASVHTATGSLNFWVRAAVGFVAGEFGYYWGHRISHYVPWLWRFHSIHHSAEGMDFLVHTRAHPLDMIYGRLCGLIPIYVLGLGNPETMEGTLVPVLAILFGKLWGFFIHANVRWRFGALEWLISTPAFHHWHHTRTGPINRNFSSNLPLLDWMFGSLYLPKEWPPDYGIKARIPEALVDQLVYPLFPSPATAPAPVPSDASQSADANTAMSSTESFPLAPR